MPLGKPLKGIPLINLLINCISARSAAQILSIGGECTFLLKIFQSLVSVILQLINF